MVDSLFPGRMLAILAIVAWFALVQERSAYGYTGYVDPGSGLLLLQSIGSVAVGFLFVIRHKILRLFGFIKTEEEQPKENAKPEVKQASGDER